MRVGQDDDCAVETKSCPMMRELLERWHKSVSPEREIEVLSSIQRLATFASELKFDHWSICAGTGITTWWDRGWVLERCTLYRVLFKV